MFFPLHSSWPYLNPVGEAELPLAPGAIEFTYEQIHYDEEEDVYYTVADYAFGANTLPGISKIKTTYTPYPPRPEPDEGIHTVYQGIFTLSSTVSSLLQIDIKTDLTSVKCITFFTTIFNAHDTHVFYGILIDMNAIRCRTTMHLEVEGTLTD